MNKDHRDITDKNTPTQTMQRSRMERGEIESPEIDDDAMIDEATRNRSDLGAGE